MGKPIDPTFDGEHRLVRNQRHLLDWVISCTCRWEVRLKDGKKDDGRQAFEEHLEKVNV